VEGGSHENLCEELKKLDFESDWENSRVNPRAQ